MRAGGGGGGGGGWKKGIILLILLKTDLITDWIDLIKMNQIRARKLTGALADWLAEPMN
jgi:hypothetical protein